MRRISIVLAVLVAAALTATAAFGSNVHFRHGSGITCSFSQTNFADDTVTCTGTGGLSGLGNGDVTFALSGVGDATYFCKNPGNGTEAKGQNKVPFTLPPTGITVSGGDIKNGNLAFFGPTGPTLGPYTATAVSATGTQAGCPNDSWTTRVDAVFFTSVTLTISQSGLLFTCTASKPAGFTAADNPVTLSC